MIQKHLVYQWTRKVLYTCCLVDFSPSTFIVLNISFVLVLSPFYTLLSHLSSLPPSPSRLFHKLASSLDPHPSPTHALPPFSSSLPSLLFHPCPVSSLSFMLILLPFHILLSCLLPTQPSFQALPCPFVFLLNYLPHARSLTYLYSSLQFSFLHISVGSPCHHCLGYIIMT